jgi:hypothetical protein
MMSPALGMVVGSGGGDHVDLIDPISAVPSALRHITTSDWRGKEGSAALRARFTDVPVFRDHHGVEWVLAFAAKLNIDHSASR